MTLTGPPGAWRLRHGTPCPPGVEAVGVCPTAIPYGAALPLPPHAGP
jgi:hypothetical protein